VLKASVLACKNGAGFYASQRLASNNDIGRAYAERGIDEKGMVTGRYARLQDVPM